MAVKQQSCSGFTLVEMMIVILIVGVLAGISTPLGVHWINNAKISFVSGELSHGIGKAMGSALRNPASAGTDQPASALCISNTSLLQVVERTSTTAPACSPVSGKIIWEASLDDKVSITSNSTAVSCMCFTPRTLLTTTNCSSCLTENRVNVSIGDKNESLFIH